MDYRVDLMSHLHATVKVGRSVLLGTCPILLCGEGLA